MSDWRKWKSPPNIRNIAEKIKHIFSLKFPYSPFHLINFHYECISFVDSVYIYFTKNKTSMQISEVKHEGDVPGLWVRSPLAMTTSQQRKKINLQIRSCRTLKIYFRSWVTSHRHSHSSVSSSDFLKSRFCRLGTPGHASLRLLWIWYEKESHCSEAKACQDRTNTFSSSFCVVI